MTAPWDHRSPREQSRVEGLVLERWLPAASAFSSYWADRVEELGASGRDLDSRADLDRFPPSRELDLHRAGGPGTPALLMRPTEDQIKANAAGSTLLQIARDIRRDGPDGKRRALLTEYKPVHVHRAGADDDLAIAYSRSDLDRLHRAGARAAAILGLDDTDYLISAVPSGPTLDWFGIYHLALGASMLALHPRGHGDDLDRTLASFSLLPATAVAVPVDEAAELASLLAADTDTDCIRVDTVVTVGPPPDADTREAIRAAWVAAGANRDVSIRAAWAPPEARALWAECGDGQHGLHTYPDMEVVQVTDPLTGVPSDGDGDLTYTSAGWNGTALVRFQTGTYIERLVTDEPCPGCERTVPRIVGEVYPLAWQPIASTVDGHVRVDLRGAAAVLATRSGIEAWRVEVGPATGRSRTHRILVEVAGHIPDGEHDDVQRRLANAIGGPVELVVVPDAALVQQAIDGVGSVFADLT